MQQPTPDLSDHLHACRKIYQSLVEPLRGDLYRHCRWITGDPWDAEDLVQDTLLRAFASLSRRYFALPNLRPWLLRIATNRWIDRCRQHSEVLQSDLLPQEPVAAKDDVDPVEFGEAAEILLALPPTERAAVALVDGLGLTASDAAACLDTSEGAMRAALHRGRLRLATSSGATAAVRRLPAVDQSVVAAFCRAFNERDLEALRAALLPQARAEVIGLVHEDDRDEIMQGSIPHTFSETPALITVREVDGETMAILTQLVSGQQTLIDIWRFTTSNGGIATFRYYFFCPEVLREIASRLNMAAADHGYWH